MLWIVCPPAWCAMVLVAGSDRRGGDVEAVGELEDDGAPRRRGRRRGAAIGHRIGERDRAEDLAVLSLAEVDAEGVALRADRCQARLPSQL